MKNLFKKILIVALIGVLVGLVMFVINVINQVDETEFNKYVYYINNENIMEQTMLSKKVENAEIILEYYKERETMPSNEVTIKDATNLFFIPKKSKVKILDTLNGNIARIDVIIILPSGGTERIKGYIPINNVHDSLLYEIE